MVGMEHTQGEWHWESLSATGPSFPFPYGTRALIEEIAHVQKMQRLFRAFSAGHIHRFNRPEIILFCIPFVYHDCFIETAEQRVILMDRVRLFNNVKWKEEALAEAHRSGNFDLWFKQFKYYAGEVFNTLIRTILELQDLTEKLKPETRELAAQCESFDELHRRMLNAGV